MSFFPAKNSNVVSPYSQDMLPTFVFLFKGCPKASFPIASMYMVFLPTFNHKNQLYHTWMVWGFYHQGVLMQKYFASKDLFGVVFVWSHEKCTNMVHVNSDQLFETLNLYPIYVGNSQKTPLLMVYP